MSWCVNKHAGSLQAAADVLKEVSDINAKGWDPLKVATAVKMVYYHKEKCDSEVNKMRCKCILSFLLFI